MTIVVCDEGSQTLTCTYSYDFSKEEICYCSGLSLVKEACSNFVISPDFDFKFAELVKERIAHSLKLINAHLSVKGKLDRKKILVVLLRLVACLALCMLDRFNVDSLVIVLVIFIVSAHIPVTS